MENVDKTQVMKTVQVQEEEPVDLSTFLHNDPVSKTADVLYRNVIGPIVGFCEWVADKVTAPWNTDKELANVIMQEEQDELDRLESSSES